MSDTKYLEEALASLVGSLNRVTESISIDYSPLYGYDPRDLGINDTPGFGPFPFPQMGMTWLNRQKRGEFIPAFMTEQQLAWYRKRIRGLVVNSEVALNAVNQHCSYAIGNGLKYEVVAKYPHYEQYVNDTQAVVDALCEHNELALRESEAMARYLIDGEAFLRIWDTGDDILTINFVEPDFIRSPDGDSNENSFGVISTLTNVEDVKGYWIDTAPMGEAPDLERVDASEIVHLKHHETPSTAKRGLSAFFPVEGSLRAVEDLVTSTVSMAKARAKIAWIHKLASATSDVASALMRNQAAYTATDPNTNETLNIEKYRYGSIFRIPSGTEIEMPSANIAASDHVTVLGMVLRQIAARFSMPEYMLSSDASNANYSSTMVAESPFVKAMETLQDRFGRLFGRNKHRGPRQSLVWRQIDHAIDQGILPEEVRKGLDVQVTGPSLVVRDESREAQTNKVYVDMGVKSVKTVQMELGIDPDEERANVEEERKRAQVEQAKQPSTPGSPTASPTPDASQDTQPDDGQSDASPFAGMFEADVDLGAPLLTVYVEEGYEERTDKNGRKYAYDTDAKKRVPLKGRDEKKATPKKSKEKADPESVKKTITDFLAKGKVGPDDVKALADQLSKLDMKDINALKKELGAKGGRSKVDAAQAVAQKALEKAKTAKPETKKPEKEKPKEGKDKGDASGAGRQKAAEKKPAKAKAEKADPLAAFEKGKPASAKDVQDALAKAPSYADRVEIMRGIMDKMKEPSPSPVKVHGMKDATEMEGMVVDGITLLWEPDTEMTASSLSYFLRADTPKALLASTKYVTFTKQQNKEDEYWERQYGMTGFQSAATGGDGTIVVYNDNPVDEGTFHHEAGHNLATMFYGSTTPSANSEYGKAQREEGPVSKYGSNSDSEDFAEACKYYASKTGRPFLKEKFPKKYAALTKLFATFED